MVTKISLFAIPVLLFTAACSREPAQTTTTPAPGVVPPVTGQAVAPGTTPVVPGASSALTPAPAPAVAVAPAPLPQQTTVVREVEARPRYVVKQRSKKKSVAIVGGSAAGGAAIGALAGGGKGAGIGAIIGGVGGLVYDRSTHKKRERVD